MTKNFAFVSLARAAAPAAMTVAFAVSAGEGRATDAAPAALSERAVPCAEAVTGTVCEPAQMPPELAAYRACSDEATRRVLAPAEGVACTAAFLAVKLAFIAGIDPDAYEKLPFGEQIEVNLRAYNAYRAWNMSLAAPSDCPTGGDCDV